MSEQPFLLPTSGIVPCGKDLICPLSPKTALFFYNSDDYYFKVIEDSSIVDKLNIGALKHEQKSNGKYVVSNDKSYLERLLEHM